MTLKQRLSDAVKDAMRSKAKERLGTLRLIMAAIKQIEVDERIDLDDARVLSVLDKMAKQRRESISQFGAAGRDDLVSKETNELTVIQSFLPTPLTDQEITTILKDAIDNSGATSMRDMGKVMTIVKPKVQGRADMSTISKQIKELLS